MVNEKLANVSHLFETRYDWYNYENIKQLAYKLEYTVFRHNNLQKYAKIRTQLPLNSLYRIYTRRTFITVSARRRVTNRMMI